MDDRLANSVDKAMHLYEERKRKADQEQYDREQAARNAAAIQAQKAQVEEKKVTIGQLMDEVLFPDISLGSDPYDGTEILNDFGRIRAVAGSINLSMADFTSILQFIATRRYMMILYRDQPNALGRPAPKPEPESELVYEGEGPSIDTVDTLDISGTEDNPHSDSMEGKEW